MIDTPIFCNQCGQQSAAGATFCTRCGASLVPASGSAMPPTLSSSAAYAGFWIRFLAVLIDGLILFAVMLPVRLILHLPMGFMAASHSNSISPLVMLPLIFLSMAISAAANWIYEAYFLSSERKATLGKMVLGIKVTTDKGQRLSFLQATGRHFAKYLSAMILLIGYIMAAFTERKQALHDMIAGTLVVKS